MEMYLKGDWPKAKGFFLKTRSLIENFEDGPSISLLGVIEESNGMAPSNWKGFRELTEK